MPHYKIPETDDDGWTDWIRPVEQGYKMACCDCGLVHEMDFRIDEDRPEFRVRRNNYSTGQMRRWMRKRDEQDK